MNICLVDGCI